MATNRKRNLNLVAGNGELKCVSCNELPRSIAGFCIPCTSTQTRFEIPSENEFGNDTHLMAPELADIGMNLIEHYDDFAGLVAGGARIFYLWKKKGGKTDGMNTLARIQVPKGELGFYSKKDYILWVAADHCYFFNRFMVTATVFHELLHAKFDEFEGKLELRGHDFEGFKREVETFGYWRESIKTMAEAFEKAKQPELFSVWADFSASAYITARPNPMSARCGGPPMYTAQASSSRSVNDTATNPATR
jgi:hypothetical protein